MFMNYTYTYGAMTYSDIIANILKLPVLDFSISKTNFKRRTFSVNITGSWNIYFKKILLLFTTGWIILKLLIIFWVVCSEIL